MIGKWLGSCPIKAKATDCYKPGRGHHLFESSSLPPDSNHVEEISLRTEQQLSAHKSTQDRSEEERERPGLIDHPPSADSPSYPAK